MTTMTTMAEAMLKSVDIVKSVAADAATNECLIKMVL